MAIVYTAHAELKFKIFKNHGVLITKRQVEDTILRPDERTKGRKGRLVAQRVMDERHVLRVIYEEKEDLEVITFYPARRKRYEG